MNVAQQNYFLLFLSKPRRLPDNYKKHSRTRQATYMRFSSALKNIIIIIIIILRHESGLDRPSSPSSNSLFKGLPSRLRPLGL
jgi:hypothetical protein